MSDQEAYDRTVDVALILGVAGALRAEFGVSIDAHPGGSGNEAGVANRAFRATASHILRSIVPSGDGPDSAVTWALRRTALQRLGEVGVDGDRAATLLDQVPALGDAWLAYLALAPLSVLGNLLNDGVARDHGWV